MKNPRRLNLKHLRYFAAVARRGSVTEAARNLHVAPQTVSAQLRELEASLGQPLFERVGRRLVLTPAGDTAREYASAIFALGDELADVLGGELRPGSQTLRVGVTDSIPKLMTLQILDPVIEEHRQGLDLDCREGDYAELLGRLVAGELDMVLADAPPPGSLSRPLATDVLAESGTSLLATRALARRLARDFPRSLDGAPFLAGGSLANQATEAWFARVGIRPRVVGRIEDSALLKGFAQRGLGVIAVPATVEQEVMDQHHLACVGRTEEIRQSVYLVRARRRRPHPLVAEVAAAARGR